MIFLLPIPNTSIDPHIVLSGKEGELRIGHPWLFGRNSGRVEQYSTLLVHYPARPKSQVTWLQAVRSCPGWSCLLTRLAHLECGRDLTTRHL